MSVTRVFDEQDPFLSTASVTWPASWIGPALAHSGEPVVFALRCKLNLQAPMTTRIHVSADERYELYVDGHRVARGSERGDVANWFYESYDLSLDAGPHVVVARVQWLGALAPYAQFTHRPGFILMAEGTLHDQLSTGVAPWDVKLIGGLSFALRKRSGEFMSVGSNVHVNASDFAWDFERGAGTGWTPAVVVGSSSIFPHYGEQPTGWTLRPAVLPTMLDRPTRVGTVRHVQAVESVAPDAIEANFVRAVDHIRPEVAAWQNLLIGGGTLVVPPHTRRRVIIDLDNYYCAYPQLLTAGGAGATVRINWSEGLYLRKPGQTPGTFDTRDKANRNEIENKLFIGVGDTFTLDGGARRLFEPLWWQAGRYVEFVIETSDAPLTIDDFHLLETRYPVDLKSDFSSSDPRLEQDIAPVALRTLEMCSHESYMDCPYYEQLMYVGDTRLEVLTTFVTTSDDRLPRKALLLFDFSRRALAGGLTTSRYPSRITQVIPPFSLWWVAMVHDRALWRGDAAFVRQLMPGVRGVIDAFIRTINADGLIEAPTGWNFVDWARGWERGIPPGGEKSMNGSLNFHAAWVFKQTAELEDWLGEPELAARARRYANTIATAANQTFWDDTRGLFSEDAGHTSFSEHTQCLALLGQSVPDTRRPRVIEGLLSAPDLTRTTIYFSHYLFETYRLIGQVDRLFERLDLWFNLKKLGFKTAFESPEPSRSDCHAWSAHPVYHYFATLLGIRPAGFGFQTVTITPQFGPLTWMKGTLPHPAGAVSVDLKVEGGRLIGQIDLPESVTGTLVWNGSTHPLPDRTNTVQAV